MNIKKNKTSLLLLLLLLYYLLLPNVTIYIFYCFSNNYIILKYLIKGAKYNEK